MQHPDEGMIHTWLDGELSAEDAAALEAHVADCAQCAAAVAEARGLVAGSSRIVSALDSVPAGVIPTAKPVRRSWYATTQFRAAAALLLVAGTSLVLLKKNAEQTDKVMSAAAPRVMAVSKAPAGPGESMASGTAAVPQVATPNATLEKRAAVPPAEPQPSRMAAAAAGSAGKSENQRAEPTAVYRPLPGLAAAPQAALKAEQPRTAVQDSGLAGDVADANVVAGNALRLLRTDSLRESTQRVFELPNGAQLIMTERSGSSGAVAQSLSAAIPGASAKTSAARNAPMTPAAPPKDRVRFSDYRTITWTDSTTGRRYSLSGPLAPDQLEKFKPLVMKLSR